MLPRGGEAFPKMHHNMEVQFLQWLLTEAEQTGGCLGLFYAFCSTLPKRKAIFLYLEQITYGMSTVPPWQHCNEHNRFPRWVEFYIRGFLFRSKLFLNLSPLFLWNCPNIEDERESETGTARGRSFDTHEEGMDAPFSCASSSSSSFTSSFHWGMSTCRE